MCSQRKAIISFRYDMQAHLRHRHTHDIAPTSVRRLCFNPIYTSTSEEGGSVIVFSITLTLVIASSWKVTFPKIYLGRFSRKKFLKGFWPVFMATCFSTPITLIYRLRYSTGCNINPYYYQNTNLHSETTY